MAYNAGYKKKKGFSFFKIFLVLIILAIVGGTGYYVNYAKKQALNTLNSANSVTQKTIPPSYKGPSLAQIQNWTEYSNQEGSFNIKYPNSWVQSATRKLCPAGSFDRSIYLGPNASSVLKCGYSGQMITIGQVVVSSYIGDERSMYELNGAGFSNVKTYSVGISGVVGVKQTAEINNPTTKIRSSSPTVSSSTSPVSLSTSALANGTFIERYVFYTNNNTYVAQYIQAKTGTFNSTDALSDFDLMVTRALQFHS